MHHAFPQRRLRSGLVPLGLACALVLLPGCSQKDYDPTAGWSAERLYETAKRFMESAQFQQAVDHFETLEARYPFDPLAMQAQLDIAYSYYRYGEHDSAIAAADRFIKLHPTHEGVAYAYYLRGLVRYNLGRSFVNNVFPRDMSQMDQERLRKAFSDFRTVVTEHPDSRYAVDARKRLVYLRNKMAEHEYETAEFYFRQSAFTAVVNRVDYLLAHYDGAPVMADALALQARAYDRLGLSDLAADTRRVLAASFPERADVATATDDDKAASKAPAAQPPPDPPDAPGS
ncbi:MAG: outer membrane protein assembly factor BamD [Halofilum sp. (in: g-proteobacteria)]|nr:outer membrane protein assembly factor BamD [Halofilum sp. (in: g-proteobacteria)]